MAGGTRGAQDSRELAQSGADRHERYGECSCRNHPKVNENACTPGSSNSMVKV
jgi:hypothetical protein